MRTPAGVQENNPLGYALFNKYFAPVLSKPDVATLRSMFQNNDGGLSGYVADATSSSAYIFTEGLNASDSTESSISDEITIEVFNFSAINEILDGPVSI